MPKVPANWPSAALPRRMDATSAAFYCGLSATTFRARVATGSLPQAHKVGARVLWDRVELDRALDAESGSTDELAIGRDRAELDKRYGGDSRAVRSP